MGSESELRICSPFDMQFSAVAERWARDTAVYCGVAVVVAQPLGVTDDMPIIARMATPCTPSRSIPPVEFTPTSVVSEVDTGNTPTVPLTDSDDDEVPLTPSDRCEIMSASRALIGMTPERTRRVIMSMTPSEARSLLGNGLTAGDITLAAWEAFLVESRRYGGRVEDIADFYEAQAQRVFSSRASVASHATGMSMGKPSAPVSAISDYETGLKPEDFDESPVVLKRSRRLFEEEYDSE